MNQRYKVRSSKQVNEDGNLGLLWYTRYTHSSAWKWKIEQWSKIANKTANINVQNRSL